MYKLIEENFIEEPILKCIQTLDPSTSYFTTIKKVIFEKNDNKKLKCEPTTVKNYRDKIYEGKTLIS